MSELKTKETDASVADFIAGLEPNRRPDCEALITLMSSASGAPARMWGKSIVGFGRYQYRYASGREGEWMRIGFVPRKRDLTLYLMPGFAESAPVLERLGKHKIGKSCLYIKDLAAVDAGSLGELITAALDEMARRHPD
jgi:hypothetical protein